MQRLQEIDDRLIRTVRHSMGRNVSGVEAEIKELEREQALPGKAAEVDDFEEVCKIITACPTYLNLQNSMV